MEKRKNKTSQKPYKSPKLAEYGSVQNMTKNLAGSFTDMQGGSRMQGQQP